jgi:hypothetical protein
MIGMLGWISHRDSIPPVASAARQTTGRSARSGVHLGTLHRAATGRLTRPNRAGVAESPASRWVGRHGGMVRDASL